MSGAIRVTVTPGSMLSAQRVRALWVLRTEVLPLKLSTAPEVDFGRFSSWVSSAAQVLTFDDDGGACGLLSFHLERAFDLQGRPVVLVMPEFAALRRHVRGSAAVMRGYLQVVPRLFRPRDALCTWYLVGAGYPSSFLAIHRLCHEAWVDGEPMPAFEQQIIARFKARFMGDRVDPRTGIVAMPTIPPPLRPQLLSSAALRRYEALNPHWAEGLGLVMLARADIRTVGQVALRRITRRLRAPGEVASEE